MREKKKYCKIYKQFFLVVYFLGTWGQAEVVARDIGRAPANFVPDDDAIVVPMVIEKNFIEEFHQKHETDFKSARKKLHRWIQLEQYAADYGLEDTGIVDLPTNEEKEKFLHRNYLRFISKDVERSTNKGLQNKLEEWTTDDEIDAITAVELHDKVLVKARKNQDKKTLKSSKTVNVGKEKFKFGVQARPEIGMMKFTLKSNSFYARAWVGINGNQELYFENKFRATNTKAYVNYYIEQARALAAVDQRLSRHWKLRFTHEKNFDEVNRVDDSSISEVNVLQLRFHMGF